MVKTRGLEEAKRKLGDLEVIVSNLLKKKKKIKIFESGCGYGKVMVQLKRKFGDKIDIIGMNLLPLHGDKKQITKFALSEKVINKSEIPTIIKPIKIIFGDAGKKLPFKTGSIDLVYSQVSSYLYLDKLHFLEEVARVLSKEGVARITLPTKSNALPEEYCQLLRIYEKGIKVEFEDYIRRFKHIKIIKNEAGNPVVEVKSGKLKFNAELILALSLNKIHNRWFGTLSIYKVK
jgi:SAM-dependent methyltransferase